MFNANSLSLSILVTSLLWTFSPLSSDHLGEADKPWSLWKQFELGFRIEGLCLLKLWE